MIRNKLLAGTALAAGMLTLFSACGEDPVGNTSPKGSFVPLVDIDAGFLGMEVISKAGSDSDLTTDDLSLTVTSSDGSYVQTWDSYADFKPDQEQFPIGDYTVEVAYGDRAAEGFDNKVVAAYYDSQEIRVKEGAATPVKLTASRTHAIVNIKYTQAFNNYIKSGSVDLISSTGNGITYVYNDDKPESRSSLIVPGRTKVLVDIEKYNGTWINNVKAASFETKARGSYTVTLDVNEGSLGGATLSVSLNDNVTEKTFEVDISDDVVNAPAPELKIAGIESGARLTLVEGTYEGNPINVTILAKGELAAVDFTVSSTFLDRRAAWEAATTPGGINLIDLEQGQQGKYKEYGLECHGIWNQPGRLAVIDLTNILNNLEYLDYDKSLLKNISTFTLSARDKYGKESEAPVSFSVEILPIELAILEPSYLNIFDTEMDVKLSYNGGDPTDKVAFSVQNLRGTYDPVSSEMTHLDGDFYQVHLTGLPSDERDLVLRAEVNGRRAEITVPRHGVIAYASDNDVFAKRAYVTLQAYNLEQSDINNPTFQLKSDNNKTLTYSKYAENVYLVEGLTPNALNQLNISFTNAKVYCPGVKFTTEAATQLANSTFETAFPVINSQSHWENVEVPGGWGTNNAMTTSQGGNFAYVRISGTIQTDDGHSGKAALIRTVGWGSNNTAVGTMGGVMKYADAGLLHIGSTRTARPSGYGGVQGPITTDDLECGTEFSSRPSALSFWYKYSPKNSSDQGEAEIWIKDADGQILSTVKKNLPKADSYTQISLPLTYGFAADKAAKIYVKFLSTNDRKFLEKNADYITPPPFGGSTGNATYMGSQLYIDDIELIY